MSVSVRELKNHLSQYLRRVREGEELVITSHGRPVACLSGLSAPDDSREEITRVIERLHGLSWVIPGNGRKVKGSKQPIRLKPGSKTMADIVLEDRE